MKRNFWYHNISFFVLAICLIQYDEAKPHFKSNIIEQDTTQEIINTGAGLFDGSTKLTNGGASCLTCHHVANKSIIGGGLLAKDLTKVYSRMGETGISAILGSPPFPAMSSTYKNKNLTPEEIRSLVAFLQYVDQDTPIQLASISDGNTIFWLYSPIGLILWLIIVYFLWHNRKKESVKKEIFDRQIKPIN